jgi:hypothetical protein
VNDQCVRVFLPMEVRKYYELKEPEVRLNTDFMVKFYEKHNTNQLLATWWNEYRKFVNRESKWYNTINLREPYMFLMALIFRLCGERDCSKFSEAWISLEYRISISIILFNWGTIISKQLSNRVDQA